MKYYNYVFVIASLLITTASMEAADQTPKDIIVKDTHDARPRDVSPVVLAELMQSSISFEVSYYTGWITVEIWDDDGAVISTIDVYSNGTVQDFINIEDLDEGDYIIKFVMDSHIYAGCFCK